MKGLRLYLMASGLFMVLYLVAQYYKPKPTNWTATYLKEDKIPFGLFILYQELSSFFPGAKVETTRLPVYNTLKDKKMQQTSYILIAGEVSLDRYDFKELVRFMEDGNHVLIAVYKMNDFLRDTLHLRMNSVFPSTKRKGTPLNFVNPSLKEKKPYIFDKGLGDQYFSKLDTSKAIALGRNDNGDVNFVKYPFGKGGLYLLASPQLFSNYNLLNPEGARYVSKVFSYLPPGQQVLWDENNTKGSMDNETELRVLLKHDQLRWAYYLSLAGLVLFVVFEMKRRQRIIPVIEPLKNTSVDFVKVVGKVYYQQRDNRDLIQKKVSYFMEYIRTRYYLKTSHINEEFISLLMQKSELSEELIRPLFDLIHRLNNATKVTDDELIDLNKRIEKFYKQAQ